jgi:protein gp37
MHDLSRKKRNGKGSMGKTKIEWTSNDDGTPGRTWNPTRGCSRVSEGCRNCYAERIAARFSAGQKEDPTNCDPPLCELDPPLSDKTLGIFEGFAIRTPSGPRWTGKVELIESKLTEPLHWKKPQRVFVNSMSDLFHEALPDDAIGRVFAVMALCPHITFQVLTKRPERMLEWSRRIFPHDSVMHIMSRDHGVDAFALRWPLPNVWLGVSVEDQATADARIPLLLQTPAAIRFVSYEPALGPVDFGTWIDPMWVPNLDWIICGGESGPGARPARPDWFRQVRDQCQAAGVAFFFKQWGEYHPITRTDGIHESPFGPAGSQHMIRVGKKKAGALLDGREWKEFPK